MSSKQPAGTRRLAVSLRPFLSVFALSALGVFSAGGTEAASIQAYAWPPSVEQGDTVGIYVSSTAPTFDASVTREGKYSVLYATYGSVPGVVQAVPDSSWAKGCGWVPSLRIGIPDSWPSGVYVVKLTILGGLADAIFTVRENNPGSTGRILFQNGIATWQAYNAWGGKSLYDYNSTDHVRSHVVSFQRPYDIYQGRGDFPIWEAKFIHWLEAHLGGVEYCTSLDLHANPDLEQHYDLVLSVGHDEYWSWEMRQTIEDRIARGGNVAFFGGNTCWWQIRISPELDRITCYKDKYADPLYGIENDRVTVNWYDDPVYRPENSMTGVSFRHGGYVNYMGWYPASEGYGGYTALRTDHWIYTGTGLSDGDIFGRDYTIVGYEVDGALFTMVGDLPVVTGTDGTPLSYTILGLSPATLGYATMGLYTAGGTVFNAATTDWSHGLGFDANVQKITANVIDVLLAGSTSVAGPGGPGKELGPAGRAKRVELRIEPNPARPTAEISWAAWPGPEPTLAIYSVTGSLVARPPVERRGEGGRALWDGRDLAGKLLPAGIYMAVLREANRMVSRKILLLR